MLGGIGMGEMLVILMVILLLFGAKRLPEIARSLGVSIFEFKKAVNSNLSELKKVMDENTAGSARGQKNIITDAHLKSEKTEIS
jgi:sec-independent protein translocase protein TatA